MENILIIDDEIQIRRLLEITLSANGYRITEAANGREGLSLAASYNPALILLDLGLPDTDGQQILKKLREWYLKPVIILSVRNSEEEIISALDNGANDYITKPFRTGELLARMRVAMRLPAGEESSQPVFETDGLIIDQNKHTVMKNNEMLKLTTTEFSLLLLLAKYEGRVLTHNFILKELWGVGAQEQTQNLRVFMAQLRKKIEDDPSKPRYIITESGIGYRFNG